MKSFRISFLFVFANLFALQALGVGVTGTIVGTVADKSAAVVVGAKVTIRNQETNAARETQTNTRGEYNVSLLPPGTYEITVEMTGFQKAVAKNVKLAVDQTARIDVTLQVGSLSQQVVISEEAPLVQTDTSTVGGVIDPKKVHELPLNERNFLAFTLLVPGAQLPSDGSQNSTQGGAISVNGAREQSNNFLLDGVDNNDLAINQYSVLPSVDAIQEFKVQSSTSTAEFGRSGGAQINVAFKSGGNQFHGSAFEFMRNRHLDAKNFFDQPDCTASSVPGTCAGIPRLDRNQFGGSFGGPIKKDKTFFFVAYEHQTLRQATTRQATVPSVNDRAAALAAVPVAQQNASGVAILNLIPLANVGANLTTSNTFVAAPSIRNDENLGSVKIDQNIGSRDVLSGHYAIFDEDRFNPFDPLAPFTNLPGYGSSTINRGQSVRIDWTHSFSSKLVNEARFGFNRLRGAIIQQNSGTNFNQQLGFPTGLPNPIDFGYPNVLLPGFDSVGEPTNLPQDRHDNTFQWIDNLAWNPGFNSGRHQLKFGVDIRRFQLNFFLDALARNEWLFFGGAFDPGDPTIIPARPASTVLTDLVAGLPGLALGVKGNTVTGLRTTSYDFYVQDDIRLSPRVTLNIGLRYEYNQPPTDKYKQLYIPDLSAAANTCTPVPDCQFFAAGTHGFPAAGFPGTNTDFAPRVGLAWRPLASDRFVVRLAYGMFYDAAILNANIFPRFNPPGFEVAAFSTDAVASVPPSPGNPGSVGTPGTLTIQSILSGAGAVGTAVPNYIDQGYRDGNVQQWNVGVQYEVVPSLLLDLAYVGSKGTHLADQRDINQPRPGPGPRPFPAFGGIDTIESNANSLYNALQFRAEKRLSHGLTFLAAYTFSRSIDNASALFGTKAENGFPQDSQNLSAERGLSNFNSKHRLVINELYQLPLGKGQKWLNRDDWVNGVLGNWQVGGVWSFQTGHPFTVNSANPLSNTSTDLGVFDRPNILENPFIPGPVPGNPTCIAPSKVHTVTNWYNPCAFIAQSTGFGNEGRNALIGPTFREVDLSLLKDILMHHEGMRLQFRAEFFNIFNHPNFDLPNNSFVCGTPTVPPAAPNVCQPSNFSAILSANATGNANSKPPRQIQFGLRFTF